MKEQTECSETSAYKIQTPRNYTEAYKIQNKAKVWNQEYNTFSFKTKLQTTIRVFKHVIRKLSPRIQDCIKCTTMYVILWIRFNNIKYVIVSKAMRAGKQVPPFQRNVTFPKESSLHNLGRKIFKAVINFISPLAQSRPKSSWSSKFYKVYENSPIPMAARSKKWVCGL